MKNLALIFSSFFLGILFAEFILRLLGVGFGNAPMQPSVSLHHEHPRSYSFLMYDFNKEFGGHQVYYDENGIRVSDNGVSAIRDKDTDDSIIFLGDSFTEGNQVTYEQTFVSLVQDYTERQTINLGVSSYSPLLYLIQTRNFVQNFEAKTVILQIFRNDFINDRTYANSLVYEDGQVIGFKRHDNTLLAKFVRYSYLARFLRKSQITIKETLRARFANHDRFSEEVNRGILYEQNVNDSDITNTAEILARIQQELSLMHKKLIVFIIPSKFLSQEERCCEQDRVTNVFKKQLDLRNIEFIDVSSNWEKFSDQGSLFYEKDIHLTPKGHLRMAEIISEYLDEVD